MSHIGDVAGRLLGSRFSLAHHVYHLNEGEDRLATTGGSSEGMVFPPGHLGTLVRPVGATNRVSQPYKNRWNTLFFSYLFPSIFPLIVEV